MNEEIKLILENQYAIMDSLEELLSNTPFPTGIKRGELREGMIETRKFLQPKEEKTIAEKTHNALSDDLISEKRRCEK